MADFKKGNSIFHVSNEYDTIGNGINSQPLARKGSA